MKRFVVKPKDDEFGVWDKGLSRFHTKNGVTFYPTRQKASYCVGLCNQKWPNFKKKP